MPKLSDVTVDIASAPDSASRLVRVSYVLTLSGSEFVNGPAFEETFTLWARDFGLRADNLGVQRPSRFIRLRAGQGEPIVSPENVKERFRFEWTQSLRSLAEDEDVRLPRGRTVPNLDELTLEVRLTPFQVGSAGPEYHDFTGNFG